MNSLKNKNIKSVQTGGFVGRELGFTRVILPQQPQTQLCSEAHLRSLCTRTQETAALRTETEHSLTCVSL